MVRSIRTSRSWHRVLGLALSVLVIVSAVTGVLLGYKKQSDWLQPGTARGAEGALADWRPLYKLEAVARQAIVEAGVHADDDDPDVELTLDRMDVRPAKNVVKVRFEEGDWEVQVDGITGAVLTVGQRNADWIERIHDGSIVSEGFKLVSMNTVGLGLLAMVGSGLWLWYGPRRVRQTRQGRQGRQDRGGLPRTASKTAASQA